MKLDIDINVYVHDIPRQEAPPWARELKQMLGLIIRKEDLIMSAQSDALDQAEAAAAADQAADSSAMALLTTLSTLIAGLVDNQTDPATVTRINALAAGINERAAALSAAVIANTPASPPPSPPV